MSLSLSRRKMMAWGLASAGVPVLSRVFGATAFAQDFGPSSGLLGVVGGRDEKALFPGPNMPGGAQTEIRMVQSIYTSDPDELEVAFRMAEVFGVRVDEVFHYGKPARQR